MFFDNDKGTTKVAHRSLSKKGFDPKIDYGRYICNISNLPEYCFLKHFVKRDSCCIIS